MLDETGTESTRSDALSADEVLFGDAGDDAAAAVAEEQDANEETATRRPHRTRRIPMTPRTKRIRRRT